MISKGSGRKNLACFHCYVCSMNRARSNSKKCHYQSINIVHRYQSSIYTYVNINRTLENDLLKEYQIGFAYKNKDSRLNG